MVMNVQLVGLLGHLQCIPTNGTSQTSCSSYALLFYLVCFVFIVSYLLYNFDTVGSFCCSKSEYVRCLHFTREDSLYVATNHGYLYHAKLSSTSNVKWTKLVQVSEGVPIICMDLLSNNVPEDPCGIDDWVALGDGKGNMTVVGVLGDVSAPEMGFTFTWSAGIERQLLGTYWCRSLGYR